MSLVYIILTDSLSVTHIPHIIQSSETAKNYQKSCSRADGKHFVTISNEGPKSW